MVSTGAGVSQQGQNQVSMDAQTCLACKSNWCTTRPQEVTTHVPDRLMAEYPTPRLVRGEGTTLVSQSGPRQTRKLRFPWGVVFIYLCQNSSLPDNLSSRAVWQWAEFKRWVKLRTKMWHVLCLTALCLSAEAAEGVTTLGLLPHCGRRSITAETRSCSRKAEFITTNNVSTDGLGIHWLKNNNIIKCQELKRSNLRFPFFFFFLADVLHLSFSTVPRKTQI